MKTGVVFPQFEIGSDPVAIRDFAQTAEGLGFAHVLAFDHVVGASHEDRDVPVSGPFTEKDPFHEPMTLLAFLAAATSSIELATGILVLPQRQTALVAKQAAEVALLSGDRLRLGVAAGWNHVEFAALGADFGRRGKRFDEQLEVLRLLWSQELVAFEGQWDKLDRVAIAPRPRRSIPIWLGGMSTAAYRRAARYGDGFLFTRVPAPGQPDGPAWTQVQIDAAAQLREIVGSSGRDAAAFPIEGRTRFGLGPGSWMPEHDLFHDAGFAALTLDTSRSGLSSVDDHIDALETYAANIPVAQS